MNDIIKIFALGGLDEECKNLYVVEINNDIFVLDCGSKYPEKAMRGIDLIIPDYSYLVKNKQRIVGYFISKGHEENMGSLAFILEHAPAPVYCSRATSILIKDNIIRQKKKIEIEFVIAEPNSDIKVANRVVSFFSLTHYTPQSVGISISTSQGNIVYLSDFVVDCDGYAKFRTNLKRISEIAKNKTLCLLMGSRGALKEDFASPNHKITPHIERLFQEHEGRIIVTSYDKNLFLIQEIITLVNKNNKKIIFFSKNMRRIIKEMQPLEIFDLKNENRAKLSDINNKELEKDLVIMVTSHGEKLFKTIQRITNGEMEEEFNFKFQENDLIINVAPPTPSTEVMSINTIDELFKTDAKVKDIKSSKYSLMNAQKEDIKIMLSLFKPKYFFPINGYYRELVANANIANDMRIDLNHRNILVYDNGMVALFMDGQYKSGSQEITTGEIMIDGLGMFDVGSVVINDRNKLSEDGVIILGVGIDKESKQVIAGPDIQTRGLVFVKAADELLSKISEIYIELVNETFANKYLTHIEKRQLIRERIGQHIRKEIGKDPLVLSLIVEI